MNKIDVTNKLIAQDTNYKDNPKAFNMLYRAWWVNWRAAEDRRFRLTDKGFQYFKDVADIKFFNIKVPFEIIITNKVIIDLDKFINCPYFLDNENIYVTTEKMAVQLVLFDGDLTRFGEAKRQTRQRKLDKTIDTTPEI
jgi:hypothetical protein